MTQTTTPLSENMREIKFRAWTGSRIQPRDIIKNLKTVSLSKILEWTYKWYIPMQYTGLKDENWVEIYEGDIIEDNCWARYVVESKWYEYCLQEYKLLKLWGNTKWTLWDMSKLIGSKEFYWRVIWNIHDNPELLSQVVTIPNQLNPIPSNFVCYWDQ